MHISKYGNTHIYPFHLGDVRVFYDVCYTYSGHGFPEHHSEAFVDLIADFGLGFKLCGSPASWQECLLLVLRCCIYTGSYMAALGMEV